MPAEILEPGTAYRVDVLAIAANGKRTVTETTWLPRRVDEPGLCSPTAIHGLMGTSSATAPSPRTATGRAKRRGWPDRSKRLPESRPSASLGHAGGYFTTKQFSTAVLFPVAVRAIKLELERAAAGQGGRGHQ